MNRAFISYRRKPWFGEVIQLADELCLRGIRVFLDVSEQAELVGHVQAEALQKLVRNCDAFLLHVTDAIVESAYIWNLEVPTALDNADADPTYYFIPFFRQRDPQYVRDHMIPHGLRIAARSGVLAVTEEGQGSTEIRAFLIQKHREAARLVLEGMVNRNRSVLDNCNRPVSLRIDTRLAPLGSGPEDLVLDWTRQFPGGGPAPPTAWPGLQRALRDIHATLHRLTARRLHITGSAHLAAAVSLGYEFRRPSGFDLEIAHRGDVWASTGSLADSPLEVTSRLFSPGQPDALLIVAVSRPEIVRAAQEWAARQRLDLVGTIIAQPPGGAHRRTIASSAEARAAVATILRAVMQARAEWSPARIHLFMAGPFPLAVLLGHELNAVGTVILYEYDQVLQTYVEAATLT